MILKYRAAREYRSDEGIETEVVGVQRDCWTLRTRNRVPHVYSLSMYRRCSSLFGLGDQDVRPAGLASCPTGIDQAVTCCDDHECEKTWALLVGTLFYTMLVFIQYSLLRLNMG